jgi:hypothetical protein
MAAGLELDQLEKSFAGVFERRTVPIGMYRFVLVYDLDGFMAVTQAVPRSGPNLEKNPRWRTVSLS